MEESDTRLGRRTGADGCAYFLPSENHEKARRLIEPYIAPTNAEVDRIDRRGFESDEDFVFARFGFGQHG